MKKDITTPTPIPQISIVIPMYNCANFVHELLTMFADQTFTDYEVICVIDGATDGTEEAVVKYCEKDNRFNYIYRENAGAGAARNTGMDLARGKYIAFCDADDEYSSDYLQKLYEAAEAQEAQITVCGAATFDYRAGRAGGEQGFNKLELAEGRVYSAKCKKRIIRLIDIQICNRLFLLDFLKDNGLRYSETKVANDVFFSKAAIACADRITVIHEDLVTVRRFINPGSISSARGKQSQLALTEWQKLYKWLENRDLLKYFLSDYLIMIDGSSNYEIKSGVNPLFAKEMVRILNAEEPWKKLTCEDITRIFRQSLGPKAVELTLSLPKDADADEIERIKLCNEIIRNRNENRAQMQQLIKKEFLEQYGRNLDDPESLSPLYVEEKTTAAVKQEKNTNSPAVTVVIPMYNCADYVNEVLSMFAAQTLTDFEVICVIDGATDDTEEKVKQFCETDDRFRYVVQDNAGPGPARNTGLDEAKGRYIIFADADDEYSEDYLKRLYDTALKHDAQIVICRYIRKNNISDTEKSLGFNEKIVFENIPYSHYGIEYLFSDARVPNKFFNMDFLVDKGLRFPDKKAAEDAFFSFACMSVADRIVFLQDTLSIYRCYMNRNSISSNWQRFQHDVVDVFRILYHWLIDHGVWKTHFEDYMNMIKNMLLYNGGYEATPKFISEFCHMLNTEEPFVNMTSDEIMAHLEECLFANIADQKENELSNYINRRLIEEDTELSYLLFYYRNRIHTAELLRKVSKERYGRHFTATDVMRISEKRKKVFNYEKNINISHNAGL